MSKARMLQPFTVTKYDLRCDCRVMCAGAKALRDAQADMLSCTEGSHAAETEALAAIGAAAEQGSEAMQGGPSLLLRERVLTVGTARRQYGGKQPAQQAL